MYKHYFRLGAYKYLVNKRLVKVPIINTQLPYVTVAAKILKQTVETDGNARWAVYMPLEGWIS